MDSVRSMISESLLTDWLDPDPLRPLLMSDMAGDQPITLLSICGPAAPILESTRAPPIQRKNGPSSWMTALGMKGSTIPPPRPPSQIQKPPLFWIQLSTYASKPIPKSNQWSR